MRAWFRVSRLGFRVRVWRLGFGVQGLGLRVEGLVLVRRIFAWSPDVEAFRVRVQCLGFKLQGLALKVYASGFSV